MTYSRSVTMRPFPLDGALLMFDRDMGRGPMRASILAIVLVLPIGCRNQPVPSAQCEAVASPISSVTAGEVSFVPLSATATKAGGMYWIFVSTDQNACVEVDDRAKPDAAVAEVFELDVGLGYVSGPETLNVVASYDGPGTAVAYAQHIPGGNPYPHLPDKSVSASSGTIVVNEVTGSAIDVSIDLIFSTGEHLQARIVTPFCDQSC